MIIFRPSSSQVFLLNDPAYAMGFGDPACGKGVEVVSPRIFWTALSKDDYNPADFPPHPPIPKKYRRAASCPRLVHSNQDLIGKVEAKHQMERSVIPLAQLASMFRVPIEKTRKQTPQKPKKSKRKDDSTGDAPVEDGSTGDGAPVEDGTGDSKDDGTGDATTQETEEKPADSSSDDERAKADSDALEEFTLKMAEKHYDEMPDWLRRKRAEDERKPPEQQEVGAGLQLLLDSGYSAELVGGQVRDLALPLISRAWARISGSSSDEADANRGTTASSSVGRISGSSSDEADANTAGVAVSAAGTAALTALVTSTSSASLLRAGAARWKEVGKSVGGLRRMLNAVERYGIKGIPKELLTGGRGGA